jgi:hypothetical protein
MGRLSRSELYAADRWRFQTWLTKTSPQIEQMADAFGGLFTSLDLP